METTSPSPSSQTDADKRRWFPVNCDVTANDVLCGKGKTCFNHPGNRRFRAIVDANLQRYQSVPNKLDKSAIVNEIVAIVRSGCSSWGGFVRSDLLAGRWYEIGDEAAREKVGQVIRDAMLKQDPDGLQKKQRKRKSRATERKERKCAAEQGLQVPQRVHEPRLMLIRRAEHRSRDYAASKQTDPSLKDSNDKPPKVSPQAVRSNRPCEAGITAAFLDSDEPKPASKKTKKTKIKTKKVAPQTEPPSNDAPFDFYEKLLEIYREQVSDHTSVSTYSGRDTGDEMSDLSDHEYRGFIEEEGEKAIFV